MAAVAGGRLRGAARGGGAGDAHVRRRAHARGAALRGAPPPQRVARRRCALTCVRRGAQATNLNEPRVERLAEVPQLEAFPHAFAGACARAARSASLAHCAGAQCFRGQTARRASCRCCSQWAIPSGRWCVSFSQSAARGARCSHRCDARAGFHARCRPGDAVWARAAHGGHARRCVGPAGALHFWPAREEGCPFEASRPHAKPPRRQGGSTGATGAGWALPSGSCMCDSRCGRDSRGAVLAALRRKPSENNVDRTGFPTPSIGWREVCRTGHFSPSL